MSRKYRFWSPEEDEVIRKNCGKLKPKEVANILDRTEIAVKQRAFKLDVSTATQVKRHKGNSAVRQKDIEQAVALYKEHGSGPAAAAAGGIPKGRMVYLIWLARRYEMLPPSGIARDNGSETQKEMLSWIRDNPSRTTLECIAAFRRKDVDYRKALSAHKALRRRKLIQRQGALWSSIR